jgi:hypothetical protein
MDQPRDDAVGACPARRGRAAPGFGSAAIGQYAVLCIDPGTGETEAHGWSSDGGRISKSVMEAYRAAN